MVQYKPTEQERKAENDMWEWELRAEEDCEGLTLCGVHGIVDDLGYGECGQCIEDHNISIGQF